MRVILGTYPSQAFVAGIPLSEDGRIVFRRSGTQMGCYFELIVPYFERMASEQHIDDLTCLNVCLVIGGNDLNKALALCATMLEDFSSCEDRWSHLQGWLQEPGCVKRDVRVNLYRKRLLNCVHWLGEQFENARQDGHLMVIGSGVFYRVLAGIPSDGSLVYS